MLSDISHLGGDYTIPVSQDPGSVIKSSEITSCDYM